MWRLSDDDQGNSLSHWVHFCVAVPWRILFDDDPPRPPRIASERAAPFPAVKKPVRKYSLKSAAIWA